MKKLCSGNDCFNTVDTYFFKIKEDGTAHPASTLCGKCETPETRKTLKNWWKRMKKKRNKKDKLTPHHK